MAVIIDVTGVADEAHLFAPSPLAELAAMLHVLAEPGHHPALHGWVTATTAALKADLGDRLVEADFLGRSARPDFLMPGRPRATLAEELDDVDRVDDEAYAAAALLITCGMTTREPLPSPLASADGRRRALDLARARGPRQASFAERLIDDPPAVRSWVRRLLEDCEQAFFAEAWDRVRIRLAADARHKADVLTRHGLGALLSGVSPATTLSGDGRRIVIDKLQDNATSAYGTGVTFIPTVFGHPHLIVVHAPGWRPVVQYPVGDASVPRAVPLDVVERRIEALAHPVRRRLARTIARSPHTTGELAETWRLSAPEVSRHLAVLRDAGLVTVARRGRYVHYRLDLATCARLGADFVEAILR